MPPMAVEMAAAVTTRLARAGAAQRLRRAQPQLAPLAATLAEAVATTSRRSRLNPQLVPAMVTAAKAAPETRALFLWPGACQEVVQAWHHGPCRSPILAYGCTMNPSRHTGRESASR